MPHDQEYKSELPELKLPEGGFKSNIPESLLDGVDEQTAWLMREISKNTAATEFACRSSVDTNRHLRALNGKTLKNEAGIIDLKEKIDDLESQSNSVTPFIKPISQFSNLWQYKAFKWIFILGCFFIIFILYPYYLAHPFTQWLQVVISHYIGSP